MAPSEKFLKNFLCSHCHVGILYEHPEEKFAIQGYFKCIFCGFTKHFPKKLHNLNTIGSISNESEDK